MIKRKIKYFLITISLIFFLCLFLYFQYLRLINPKLMTISQDYMKKNIYNEITKISSLIMNDIDSSQIINIYQNNEGEILYASYNLKECYKLLNSISSGINKELLLNEIIIKEPFFIYSNYAILSNLGPQINVRIRYINMSLSNIYTKITNYGMNNALVEVYVTINIKGRIITPVSNKEETIKYDMLISSLVINGRVPSFYGGTITTSSNYFDIPILI